MIWLLDFTITWVKPLQLVSFSILISFIFLPVRIKHFHWMQWWLDANEKVWILHLFFQTSSDYCSMINQRDKLLDCLFMLVKTVAFTSGFREIALQKCITLNVSKYALLPAKQQLKAWFRARKSVYSTETASRLEARCQKAAFHLCKTWEWSDGEWSTPSAELSNVKNGILRPQGLHPGSVCLEGGWSRRLKSALREARCNQASKMRMTTSTLVDWGCLGASLSAGHHQERLLRQPLWPYCGFKFPFEGRLAANHVVHKHSIS